MKSAVSFSLEFEGYWVKNQKHFRGINRYENGDKYSGDWFYGEKHGTGMFP